MFCCCERVCVSGAVVSGLILEGVFYTAASSCLFLLPPQLSPIPSPPSLPSLLFSFLLFLLLSFWSSHYSLTLFPSFSFFFIHLPSPLSWLNDSPCLSIPDLFTMASLFQAEYSSFKMFNILKKLRVCMEQWLSS